MEDCIDMVDDKEYDKSPSHVKKTIVEGILARVCLWRAGYPSEGGQPFMKKLPSMLKLFMTLRSTNYIKMTFMLSGK